MADLETLLTYLTLISVPIGVFYHIMTLNNTKKNQQMQLETRQAQLFMHLFDKITSQNGIQQIRIIRNAKWENHEEWLSIYLIDDPYRNAFGWFITTMEGFGVFIREGLVDIRLIALFIAGPSREMWGTHKEIIYKERERRKMKRYGSEWEYLYNELTKYIQDNPELET